jgi:hypothetical protein
MLMPQDSNTFKHVCTRFYNRVFVRKKIEDVVPISNDENFQKLTPNERKSKLQKEFLINKREREKPSMAVEVLYFSLDITFNVLYTIMLMFSKTLFNYFGGVIVILIQMLGYWYTNLKPALDAIEN